MGVRDRESALGSVRRTGDSRSAEGLSPGGMVRHGARGIGSCAGDIDLYLAPASGGPLRSGAPPPFPAPSPPDLGSGAGGPPPPAIYPASGGALPSRALPPPTPLPAPRPPDRGSGGGFRPPPARSPASVDSAIGGCEREVGE